MGHVQFVLLKFEPVVGRGRGRAVVLSSLPLSSLLNYVLLRALPLYVLALRQSGPGVVKARQLARTDRDVLEKYGDGDVWPMAAAWDLGERCSNGNYLENDDIAVSHGVCGDTPQVTYFRSAFGAVLYQNQNESSGWMANGIAM